MLRQASDSESADTRLQSRRLAEILCLRICRQQRSAQDKLHEFFTLKYPAKMGSLHYDGGPYARPSVV